MEGIDQLDSGKTPEGARALESRKKTVEAEVDDLFAERWGRRKEVRRLVFGRDWIFKRASLSESDIVSLQISKNASTRWRDLMDRGIKASMLPHLLTTLFRLPITQNN